jgi:penicillin-binding protein 2
MNNLVDRRYLISAVIILIGLIYMSRLFYIQIIDDKYELSAKLNAFRKQTEFPPRGYIYDRKGNLLVTNDPAYDLMVVPKEMKDVDTLALCKILGIDSAGFRKRILRAKQTPRKESYFEKQISSETYAALTEKMYRFRGFHIQKRTVRRYRKKIAAHLMGYIGEVSKAKTEKDTYYKEGDYIGISGIERSYESELRGVKGVRILLVDVHNKEKGSYMNGKFDTLAIPGKPLYCTLDAELQAYGEKLMQGKKGSIVAIEPTTGEVLCLVSSPTYDPNLLVGRERAKNFGVLAMDTINVPLFSRATQAAYPPGSIFKLIDALVGQQEGVLETATQYPCAGGYPPMGGKPKCHRHPGVDLYGSIQYSCNSYYSYVFRSIVDQRKFKSFEEGYDNWRKHVMSFGTGKRLGTDIPLENSGNVPSIKYYNKVFGENHWRSNTVVSLGIGQAELLILPIQMANVMCIIANRGFYYTPHIVKGIGKEKMLDPKFSVKNFCSVDEKYFPPVIEGMRKVVEAGTAAASKLPDISICGKTGTAQNPHGEDHAVFVAFAPMENPKIAIACIVENSGFGGTWAAPIASLMIEKYLKGEINRKDLEKRMMEADLINKKNLIANKH